MAVNLKIVHGFTKIRFVYLNAGTNIINSQFVFEADASNVIKKLNLLDDELNGEIKSEYGKQKEPNKRVNLDQVNHSPPIFQE